MKKKLFSVFSCFVLIVALTEITSNRVTAKPLNAAATGSGTGCLVKDADGNYWFDGSCNWHTVRRYDKDGNLIELRYQDQGTLPDFAPRPSRAISETYFSPDLDGWVTEITTPSGQYKSDFVRQN